MMRFAMRSSTPDPDARAALYATTIEMCAWAESRGGVAAVLSQHHAAEDGYLPSPIPLAAAIAARTTSMPINVAALLLGPVRTDQARRGPRGRRPDQPGPGLLRRRHRLPGRGVRHVRHRPSHRAALVEERITLLQRLWAGEHVDIDGRSVRVTPAPSRPGAHVGLRRRHGGGGATSGTPGPAVRGRDARRHARGGLPRRGRGSAPGCFFPQAGVPITVFVADDPERAWAEIGEYLLPGRGQLRRMERPPGGHGLHLTSGQHQGRWRKKRARTRSSRPTRPAAWSQKGMPLGLQPLVGGLPPDLAWPYLEAAAAALAPESP